tara:strand:+ start:14150 stop:15349 length:1200 start_codon:yes stop_codon:yes gene_type:complete
MSRNIHRDDSTDSITIQRNDSNDSNDSMNNYNENDESNPKRRKLNSDENNKYYSLYPEKIEFNKTKIDTFVPFLFDSEIQFIIYLLEKYEKTTELQENTFYYILNKISNLNKYILLCFPKLKSYKFTNHNIIRILTFIEHKFTKYIIKYDYKNSNMESQLYCNPIFEYYNNLLFLFYKHDFSTSHIINECVININSVIEHIVIHLTNLIKNEIYDYNIILILINIIYLLKDLNKLNEINFNFDQVFYIFKNIIHNKQLNQLNHINELLLSDDITQNNDIILFKNVLSILVYHSNIKYSIINKLSLKESNAEFECPITCDIMINPVYTEDGKTYEKYAIEKWLNNTDSPKSPLTNVPLKSVELKPNTKLKEQIKEYYKDISNEHIIKIVVEKLKNNIDIN